MNMYRNFNKVRASIVHFMAGRLVMVISAILVSLMVVRGLSVLEFAQYVTLMGLLLVLGLLSDAGISRVQPRFLPELYNQKNFKGLVFLSRSLILIRAALQSIFLLTLFFSGVLLQVDTVSKIQESVLLVFMLFSLFYVLNQQTQRTMQVLLLQKVAAKIIALEWVMKLSVLGYLYEGENSFSLFDVMAVQAFSVSVAFMVGQIVLWKKSTSLLEKGKWLNDVKQLDTSKVYHFAWKNWLQSLLAMPISPGMIRIFVASVAGSVSVAYLGFAYTIMQLLQRTLPSKMIVQAIEPVYIARYRESGDFSELNGMVSLILRLNYFILIPMGVWFAFGASATLGWISAGKYDNSGWIVSALIFLFMFENHRMALQVLCNAVDQSILLVKSNFFAMFLMPIYVIATIYWELYGLFLGLVVISWFRNAYLIYKLRAKGFNYHQDWMGLSKMIIAAVFALIIVIMALQYTTGLWASVLSLFACLFVFYGAGLKIKFFRQKERVLINKTLGKRLFLW